VTVPDYAELLDLACWALLVTAMVVLWRRELWITARAFVVQGLALALLVGALAAHEHSPDLAVIAGGILVLRAGVLPALLRRALVIAGGSHRETRPLWSVGVSLLAAAALALLAYAASQPLVALAPSAATRAIPAGVTVVLIGFLVLVTRRHALSQVVGFLLLDNGITAVGFLTGDGVRLAVEFGVSLDALLAVLVLRILTARMRETFGDTDLGDLRELHD
jgi:hydrogenase-4 component E